MLSNMSFKNWKITSNVPPGLITVMRILRIKKEDLMCGSKLNAVNGTQGRHSMSQADDQMFMQR